LIKSVSVSIDSFFLTRGVMFMLAAFLSVVVELRVASTGDYSWHTHHTIDGRFLHKIRSHMRHKILVIR